MKTIHDKKLLQSYIKKYGIDEFFEKDLSEHMILQHYDKGEDILVTSDLMEYFYFIVDGKAKIFLRQENGKSTLLRFARPLSELGSMEFLGDRFVGSCVQSLYGTTVIKIPFVILDRYAIDDANFLKYIIKGLSHKLSTQSKTHSLNTTYPFKNRFASYLISITRVSLVERIDEITIDQFGDLATFLGTSYRHLSRVVRELEGDGIIKKEKKKFIILDYDRLEALSGDFYE